MARHTTMPARLQKTPHGDVVLTSRWKRDSYHLVATGPLEALRWLFPQATETPELHGTSYRHVFAPAPQPVRVERELRVICARWQEAWQERYEDEAVGAPVSASPSSAPAITTLGQLFDHLYAVRKATVATSTSDRDRYRLQVWRDALGNTTLLSALTPERITAALEKIGARTSAGTANTALGVLKAYMTWAANHGLLRDFSHRTVRRLREPPSQRHVRAWWTSKDVELALRVAARDLHQPTATLLIACGCYLGLRVEENVMLRWQDLALDQVDPETGKPKPVCHITAHDNWQPKTGMNRDIPICGPLLEILQRHRRAHGYLLTPEPHRPGNRRGRKGWGYRYDPTATWRRLMKAIAKEGGRPITMYGMRHSFASNLLISNVTDVKVARWLGHADTRMLHRHYGHLLSYDSDIDALGASAAASGEPAKSA